MDHPNLSRTTVAALLTAPTLIALAATAQKAAYFDYVGKGVPWLGLIKADLTDWYLSAIFVPLLYVLVLYRPINRAVWLFVLPQYALAVLACTLAKEVAFVAIANWFRPGVVGLSGMLARDFLNQFIFYWATIAILSLWQLARSQPRAKSEAESTLRFLVSEVGGYRMIPVDEIQWIRAQGNYAQLNTSDGRYLIRETMGSLEQRLGNAFLRVHRGAIVNRANIRRITPRSHGIYAILISNGDEILSGRSYNQELRSLFD